MLSTATTCTGTELHSLYLLDYRITHRLKHLEFHHIFAVGLHWKKNTNMQVHLNRCSFLSEVSLCRSHHGLETKTARSPSVTIAAARRAKPLRSRAKNKCDQIRERANSCQHKHIPTILNAGDVRDQYISIQPK